jgi:methionyl-tRNA formyltransferase
VTSRTRTVFLGTGAFAVPILAALADQPIINLLAVVTAPQRAGSRGRPTDPPVAAWAAEHGLPMLRPVRLRVPEAIAQLVELRPELLVLADYGQIVPASLLDVPAHGALNVHPSLLPRHRGATPIPAAILAGEAETGVTLMRMDAGLDSGPVVAQSRVALSGSETAPQLEGQLADLGARLLVATLPHWLAGEIEPEVQNERAATMTRPLRREDGRLDASKTAAELGRQVRAYQPWPGSFVETSAGRLTVWSAQVGEARSKDVAVGTLARTLDAGLAIAASDALLELDEIQPAGGRRMSAAELLRGHPALAGSSVIVTAQSGSRSAAR